MEGVTPFRRHLNLSSWQRLDALRAAGEYSLQVSGQDAAGNVGLSPLSFNWTVALQPDTPYVWLQQGAIGSTAAQNITFDMQVRPLPVWGTWPGSSAAHKVCKLLQFRDSIPLLGVRLLQHG